MADFDVALESSEINVTLVLERTVGGEGGGGVTSWNDLEDKPTTFPPSVHNHDDLYYTTGEIDTALAGKSDTGHNHDTRYSRLLSPGTSRVAGASERDYGILGDFAITGVGINVQSTNRYIFTPIIVREAITLDRVAIEITATGGAGKLIRMGIWNVDDYWQPTTVLHDFGTVPADPAVVPALQAITINVTIPPGRYMIAHISDGSPTLRQVSGYNPAFKGLNSVASTTPLRVQFATMGGAGAVAGGFSTVQAEWERDLFSSSSSGVHFLRFREKV